MIICVLATKYTVDLPNFMEQIPSRETNVNKEIANILWNSKVVVVFIVSGHNEPQ